MNQEECNEIKQALELFLNESLERILMSNPIDSETISRSRIRPLLMKGRLVFQAEEQCGRQAFHRNLDRVQAADYVTGLLDGSFRQAEIASGLGKALILVSRKGKVTVKVKLNPRPGETQPGGNQSAGTQPGGIRQAGTQPARIHSPGTQSPREPGLSGLLSHNRKSIISWKREYRFHFWWT